jgi:hypothetical protein
MPRILKAITLFIMTSCQCHNILANGLETMWKYGPKCGVVMTITVTFCQDRDARRAVDASIQNKCRPISQLPNVIHYTFWCFVRDFHFSNGGCSALYGRGNYYRVDEHAQGAFWRDCLTIR